MGLFSTWTSANRVVTQDLLTTFTRNEVYADSSKQYIHGTGVACCYLEYTRTRTKRYKYVGLTATAAKACAAALNLLYNRIVYQWTWNDQDRTWNMPTETTNKNYKRVCCGSASPQQTAGDAWEVDVDVNESITIPYRHVAGEAAGSLPDPWSEFEANPDIRTPYFKGFGTGDFDYDED